MPWRDYFVSNEEYNKWFQEYRDKNREKLREYNREYNKKWRGKNGLEKGREKSRKKYKRENPEKVLAHKMVYRAVKAGRLEKGNCEICGNVYTHAHHEDYFKPLEVKWLCPLHHKEYHRKISTPSA